MAIAEAVQEKPKLLAELPQRLHHYAYVVRDQEKNRQFIEDLLGIPWWPPGARSTITHGSIAKSRSAIS